MVKQSAVPRHATQRSPERAQLSIAISHHADAVDNLARIRAAHDLAEQTVFAAYSAIEAAEAALGEARKNESANLAAAVLGEPGGASVADAEATVRRATDDRELARRTRDALAGRMERQGSDIKSAREAVDQAVAGVLRAEPSAGEMLERCRATEEELQAARSVLRFLVRAGVFADDHEVRSYIDNPVYLIAGNVVSDQWDRCPAVTIWRDWAAQLALNADAPMPS
jgi:hypothetical protein